MMQEKQQMFFFNFLLTEKEKNKSYLNPVTGLTKVMHFLSSYLIKTKNKYKLEVTMLLPYPGYEDQDIVFTWAWTKPGDVQSSLITRILKHMPTYSWILYHSLKLEHMYLEFKYHY